MSDVQVLDEAPVRDCYGCGKADTAPRFHHITTMGDVSTDELYHYDCIPAGVRKAHGLNETSHPAHAIYIAATGSKQLRDDKLRDFAAKHAASLVEAPADSPDTES